MMIEVLAEQTKTLKDQGDVLEAFATEWLRKQGYAVTRNVRMTACEIDLLCKQVVSGKVAYVECKAYNDKKISANDLSAFYGKVELNEFSEGWFLSTGEYGRDAKGFVEKWEARSDHVKLSLYTPERLLQSLISTQMVSNPPEDISRGRLLDGENIGDWILLITPFGRYWCVPILKFGIRHSWMLLTAESPCKIIEDRSLVSKICACGFSMSKVPFWTEYRRSAGVQFGSAQPIVEVEVGDTWSDYRPALPAHFVGRRRNLLDLKNWIDKVRTGVTDSRVFAITGDSGIGKSSFIAKFRDQLSGEQSKSRTYVFAVDMRAANDENYIEQALLTCLQRAQDFGFGDDSELSITNSKHPLESTSILRFLEKCRKRQQIIILVLDQFEELYSKPSLIGVFNDARKLMFSAISASSSFVLGFAWKTDCVIPQEHPAYFMWHNLADHRYEVALRPFTNEDADRSLSLFESEIGEKLKPDLKRYLLDSCQGYPWLLKKICIYLWDRLKSGVSQTEMENESLEIGSLFEDDLRALNSEESRCIKMIAQNAPMDWFDAVENFSPETIQSLQNKRLVLKKGSKLNLYWDIFRDYVINNTVPHIPFNYIPQPASLRVLVRGARQLNSANWTSVSDFSARMGIREKSGANILVDLVRLGIACNHDGSYYLNSDAGNEDITILRFLRRVFSRHRLVPYLKKKYSIEPCSPLQFLDALRITLSPGEYGDKTIRTYATKMKGILRQLGFLAVVGDGILYRDVGDVLDLNVRTERRAQVFICDTSPCQAVTAYTMVIGRKEIAVEEAKKQGLRNAFRLRIRIGMVSQNGAGAYIVKGTPIAEDRVVEEVFSRGSKEASLRRAVDVVRNNPQISPSRLGEAIDSFYGRGWTTASRKRIGGALRIWAVWILKCVEMHKLQPPPGRHRGLDSQMYLDI